MKCLGKMKAENEYKECGLGECMLAMVTPGQRSEGAGQG